MSKKLDFRIAEFADRLELEARKSVQNDAWKGDFWKPCPGTTEGYLCCGYQIISPIFGCGMYCAYCILQVYFDDHHQVVHGNFDDLVAELRSRLEKWKGVVRLGSGEFADSLYLEPEYGVSRKLAEVLSVYPNALIEFKTKSRNARYLKGIPRPDKVVLGFSLNSERVIEQFEHDTASLDERLDMAKWAEENGFWVAYHFDPMLYYPGWEVEYREVAQRAVGALRDPGRIAWWSMGGFRSTPDLKTHLRDKGVHLPLFSGEMVLGKDRKYRYVRPIRVEFYSAVREELDAIAPGTTLYLCMESPEIWCDSGMVSRIPQGLPSYLDRRAEQMLGLV